VIEAQLGLKSAIDDCDRLDRAMLLFTFLGSSDNFFMLGTIGLVDCTGQNGTKTSPDF
jgi:hypothetical protein